LNEAVAIWYFNLSRGISLPPFSKAAVLFLAIVNKAYGAMTAHKLAITDKNEKT